VSQIPLVCQFQAQASSVPAARHAVVEYAVEHGVVDPRAVALAVSEAVTNVVVHAYRDANGGMIEITAERHWDDGVEVTVSDSGHGIEPRVDSPGLGLGFALIASLTERFEITDGPHGGSRARMVFAAE
jgi:serine/threonine-protein kinase RsbW